MSLFANAGENSSFTRQALMLSEKESDGFPVLNAFPMAPRGETALFPLRSRMRHDRDERLQLARLAHRLHILRTAASCFPCSN